MSSARGELILIPVTLGETDQRAALSAAALESAALLD